MNTKSLRNTLLISIGVVLAMIIVVLLLSLGEPTSLKKTITFIVVLAPIAYLILLWMRTFQILKQDDQTDKTQKTVAADDDEVIIVHTGGTCEIPGTYQCTEHAHRTLNMVIGKRFPPCKGEEKGHSADWILTDSE